MFTNNEQLIYDSLTEIASHLGDRPDSPVSLSLMCLTHDISNEQKGKLFVAYNQILAKNTFADLSIELFKETTISIVPEAKSFADVIFVGLIRGFAAQLIPELYPFACTLD